MYNLVACKVCYHVLVVTFPMPHDRGCEIKIIVIVIVIVIAIRIELSIVGPINQYQCVMYPNCHIVSVVTPDSRVLALGDLRMNTH